MIWVGAAASLCAVIAFVFVSAVQGNQDPPVEDGAIPLTLVPIDEGANNIAPTVTPDAWALTGTAFANATITPTMDYCWFLTPSPTPSATPLPVTPDAWAIEGTRVYLQTGTPTPTPLPTQVPPRAWCDIAPTATIASRDTSPTPLLTETPTAIPTSTPFPALQIQTQAYSAPANPPAQNNPPPVVITAPPVVIVQTQVIVITAPPVATNTPPPTATPSPTSTPSFAIIGDCAAGYPAFGVSVSAPPYDWIQWAIERGDGVLVSSGQWQVVEMMTPAPLIAVAPSGDGLYTLKIWQWWSEEVPHVISAPVTCIAPTSTLQPTATPSPTWTPTETATVIIPEETTVQP